MRDHSFENLFLISVTASMISAGKGSSSSPNSARTACQSGSRGSARPASSIIFLTRFPWPAATARINGAMSPSVFDSGNSSSETSRDLSSQFNASVHFPRQSETSKNLRQRTTSDRILRCQIHRTPGVVLGLGQSCIVSPLQNGIRENTP